MIVRRFRSTVGRQVNNLSDTQSIYVGQLLVRVYEIIDAGPRPEIVNGEAFERVTISDGNLTSPFQGSWYSGPFVSRGIYSNGVRGCWNCSHLRRCYRPSNGAFRSFMDGCSSCK